MRGSPKLGSLKLISYFMNAYPWRSAIMVCCFVFSGLAEGISILTLLPFIELATTGGVADNSTISIAFKRVINILGLEPRLSIILALIVIAIVVKSIFSFLAKKQAGYTVAFVMMDLRLKLIRALMSARWGYYISQPAGYFVNAISSEALRASSAYQHAVLLIAALIQVFVYITLSIIFSWKITLIALIASSVIIFALKGFINVSRNAGNRQTQIMKSLIARLTDVLQGIKPVKAMAIEDNLQSIFESETRNLNRVQQRYVFAAESLKAIQEPILIILVAIGLYFAITIGHQSLPQLLIMVILFNRLLTRIYAMQAYYQEIASGESALWSLINDIEKAETEKEHEIGTLQPPPLKRSIALEGINFSYGEKVILKNASMTIPAGEFVVIVGPSGIGKTTIADLIIGLFWPNSGNVYIDDHPLSSIDLKAWRSKIGYVPQEMILFHDTIFHNVSLGIPEISRAEVESALRDSEAWDFIVDLPNGIDTVIGERGAKLSGGQRQRVSLARALVRKPQLLILDEVTTALDPVSERAICETLRQLRGNMTILAISHQPRIMEVADRVCSIKDGCIEEIDSTRRGRLEVAFH